MVQSVIDLPETGNHDLQVILSLSKLVKTKLDLFLYVR